MNKIIPTKNRVLVELENPPTMQGGIHIPERMDKGKIKPVAAHLDRTTMLHKEWYPLGTRVLVPCYGGYHVDDKHRIFEENEIIAILDEKASVEV